MKENASFLRKKKELKNTLFIVKKQCYRKKHFLYEIT